MITAATGRCRLQTGFVSSRAAPGTRALSVALLSLLAETSPAIELPGDERQAGHSLVISRSGGGEEPAQGMFLVATPDLRGSGFTETVILIIQYDDFGTVGLIINKPTTIAPRELLPDIDGIDKFKGDLHVGGPVALDGVMMLVKSRAAPDDASHVFAGVDASGSRELLGEKINQPDWTDEGRV